MYTSISTGCGTGAGCKQQNDTVLLAGRHAQRAAEIEKERDSQSGITYTACENLEEAMAFIRQRGYPMPVIMTG